jgi:hypothetical protein
VLQVITSLPTPVPFRLEILDHPEELVVQTPAHHAARRRNRLRGLGVLVGLIGLVVMPLHLASLVLIPLGIVIAALGPRLVRQTVLFRVIKVPEECLVSSLARVPIRSIVCIEGRYETSGWDGRTIISAFLADEEEFPLLEISGTDDALARAACEALSRLCRCGAVCTGPFGEVARFGAPLI